jgi:broad-specificity NMP kinase
VKLVFIYGAPGTGKLTVAREIAKQTGFRLFHNHLTVDLAASLFEHGTPTYFDYVRHLRIEAFERAAKADVNLVFTFWYSSISSSSVERYRNVIETAGGEILFVRLHCRPEILEQRVSSPSRQNWKISNVQELRDAFAQYPTSFVDTIPGTRLEIDNSDLEPEVVAEQIVTFFGLEMPSKLET